MLMCVMSAKPTKSKKKEGNPSVWGDNSFEKEKAFEGVRGV